MYQERTDWVDTPKPPPPPGSTPAKAADIKRWERGIAEAHEIFEEGRLSEAALNATYAPASVLGDVANRVSVDTMAVNVKRFGAVGDGVADDTDAVAAAHAVMSTIAGTRGKATLYFPAGQYNLRSIPNMPSGSTIMGEGVGSTTIRQTGWAGSDQFIRWTGSLPATPIASLTANAAAGSTLTVESTTKFEVGKFYLLGSDHAYSSTDPTMCKGELICVKEILSSTQISIYGFIRDSYALSGNASISRVTMLENVGLQDLAVENTEPGIHRTGVVQFYACNGITVSNVKIDGCDLQGIQIGSSVNAKLSNLDIRNGRDDIVNGFTGYGVIVGRASENVTISSSTFARLRHAVTGDSVSGSRGIPRNVAVVGCVATDTTAAAFDTHPSGCGWVFSGCVASKCQSGFQVRAKDVLLSACKATHCSDGILLTNDCDAAQVIGCVIRHMRTSGAGRGIRITGSPDRLLIKDNTFENLLGYAISVESNAKRVRIIGNLISHIGGDGSRTTAIWFNPTNSSSPGHLIRGNSFIGNEAAATGTGAESGIYTNQMGIAIDLGGSGVSGAAIVGNFASGLSASLIANLGSNFESGNITQP